MKKHLVSALVVSSALMACATQVGEGIDGAEGAQLGSEASELAIEGTPGGTGTIGAGTFTLPPPVPVVVSRSATASKLVFGFDRVVAASEIPLASMHVDVVRRVNGKFKKVALLSSAALAADGKSLTMNLTEPVKAGTAYYARGEFKRCTSFFPGTSSCRTYPAEFGQIVAARQHPVIVNGGIFTHFTGITMRPKMLSLDANAAPNADGARVTKIALPDEASSATDTAAAGPGTFRVKSMTPIESSEANTRDLRTITVQFEGGTIDCSKIAPGEAGFKLWSRSPDLGAQQLMFDDPANPLPSNPRYRGDLRCQEQENRVLFTPAGRLFGDVQYMIEAHFASKEGDELAIEKDFYTERPGVRVTASRVTNRYGGNDTCDSESWLGSDNYCDVYVTSGAAGGTADKVVRIPDSGDFSEMRKDASVVLPDGGKVLFQSAEPVGVALELDMMAHDTDDTSAWKKFLEVAGTITTNAGKAIIALEPKAGAIATLAGETMTTISEAIPENEDDLLGTAKYTVTRDTSRWGTTSGTRTIHVTKGNPDRGPVDVDVIFEEFPAPWRLPGVID